MFRILIGSTLLIVGLALLGLFLADTHSRLPTDPLHAATWLTWSVFTVPSVLGLWILLGKRLRSLLR
ncbi:MAG: hypothetical protein IPO90_17560 [Flavobacteriales bacterium]|nr:hypothetical protein [Flavobacteriales bacterium]